MGILSLKINIIVKFPFCDLRSIIQFLLKLLNFSETNSHLPLTVITLTRVGRRALLVGNSWRRDNNSPHTYTLIIFFSLGCKDVYS